MEGLRKILYKFAIIDAYPRYDLKFRQSFGKGCHLYIFTIYGAIYGYFLFEEKFENYHLIGTVLVFIGVYLAKKKNVQKI